VRLSDCHRQIYNRQSLRLLRKSLEECFKFKPQSEFQKLNSLERPFEFGHSGFFRHSDWAHLDTTTTTWPQLMFTLSSPKEERAGERRPLLLNAPLPVPLPTRASRGEGENFWWLCQHVPIRISITALGLIRSR